MNRVTTHPFAAEELMAFCDGELSAEESQAVEAHIAECQECAENVRQFRETAQSLHQWSAPPVPKRIEDAVEAQLQQEDSGRGSRGRARRIGGARRPRWRPWAFAGAGAFATVLLVGVVVVSLHHSALHDTIASPMYSTAGQAAEPDAAAQSATASPYVESRNRAPAGIAGAATTNSPLAAAAPSAPLIARSVEFTIVTKNVTRARPALEAILAKYHGYAAQISVDTPADEAPSLKASLRIPVANLAAAMQDLRGLGRVANESESGEDVTQQHADLDQRLKTARDTEERFRTILQQRTGSVSDVLQVEEEIARVRGDIESMEAEQANLEHRVDFASIDLSIAEESSPVSGSAPLSLRVRNAFLAGYRNAAGTVIGIFLFLVAYGLTILIWIAIIAIPVILLRRRYKRIHAKI